MTEDKKEPIITSFGGWCQECRVYIDCGIAGSKEECGHPLQRAAVLLPSNRPEQ